MNAPVSPAFLPGNEPVRVLQVVNGLRRGGLESGVVNLLNGLPAADFEQRLACLDHRGDLAGHVSSRVPIDVLDRRRHDVALPLRLARVIRDVRPHVVHCRNWSTWADTVVAHRLAGRQGSIVWSFHGFADGHWFPARRRIASRVLALATDHLLAVCRDAAQRFATLSRIPIRRFEVLYSGVDCRRFAPSPERGQLRKRLGMLPDELVVLTVGRLTPAKGHAELLEAAAKVLSVSERRVRFLWLGEGPERERLEARAQALGLGGRVQMPGDSDRVPQFLAAADLFVLPSELEGMSSAILEAMASGLPVIAHTVGGNPELVDHEHTGLLCECGNTEALASAIARLVHHDDERLALGDAARHRAEQIFSLEAMLVRYADFYRHVVPVSTASS
jgi:sugar transferase (PEP-CTERM/EpsH1 system associated)